MTTTNTRVQADATKRAADNIARIGQIQRRIADLLHAAAAEATMLETEMATLCDSVEHAVTGDRADVQALAASLAEHQVRTGDLNSRVVSALERRGQKVYPTPYTQIRRRWSLVENFDV